MKGRWTLRWVAPEIEIATTSRPNAVVTGPNVRWHGQEVPVVPCDDTAIRRVAAALKTIPLMEVAEEPYATAERLLRAAGETP